MSPLFRLGYFACTHARWLGWLVRWMVTSEFKAAAKNPLQAMTDSFAPYLSCPADKDALQQPEVLTMFLHSYQDMLAHGPADLPSTITNENFTWTRPWGFRLQDVHTACTVWNGAGDKGCTTNMAHYIERTLPHCTCHIEEGHGHLLYFAKFGSITQDLLAK